MKRYLFFVVAAALSFGAVSCQEDVMQPPYPEVSIDVDALDFGYESDFKEITVSANRPWTITSDADWLAFEPAQGGAVGEMKEYKVIVTALENPIGNQRRATVTVETKALYDRAVVKQAFDADRVPTDFYKITFGEKQDKGSGWPFIAKTDSWFGEDYESGYAAKTRKFYATDDQKVSIRNSSSMASTGYPGASGLNHVYLASTGTAFAIEFPLHQKITAMTLSYAIRKSDSNDGAINIPSVNDIGVQISNDGAKWITLTDISVSSDDPKDAEWLLCRKSFYFVNTPKLYVRFSCDGSNPYRFDDITVTTSDSPGENPIVWEHINAPAEGSEDQWEVIPTKELALGSEVTNATIPADEE